MKKRKSRNAGHLVLFLESEGATLFVAPSKGDADAAIKNIIADNSDTLFATGTFLQVVGARGDRKHSEEAIWRRVEQRTRHWLIEVKHRD